MRSGLVVALLGVVTCLPVYLVIYHLQANGQSAAAVAMGSMHMNRMGVFWAFPLLQAAGIGALSWAYLGLVLGLIGSGKPPRWWHISRRRTDALHRQVSLLVIALIVVHALATAEDAMGDSLRSVFLPWQESWSAAVSAYNLGIFALYLAVLVGPTYYLRHRIGTRWWMLAHRLALIIYVLSLWHTLLLGADFSYYSWLRMITWLAQVPLLGLLAYRLLKTRRRGSDAAGSRQYWFAPARYWLAVVAALLAAGVIALVAGGHANFPTRVGTPRAGISDIMNWLPNWLGIVLAVLTAGAGLFHLRHLGGDSLLRAWHAAHVMMAAGMIVMLIPVGAAVVPHAVGGVAFTVAALAALASAAFRARTDRRMSVISLFTGVDLAIMAYMFAASAIHEAWPPILLSAWLTVEGTYWSAGRLGTLILRSSVRAAATSSPARIEAALSVGFLCFCMAYMLVAMRFGAGTAPAGTPGMDRMPGMAL